MNATNKKGERIGLVESLDRKWLKLPLEIMQDCGPAVQTMAGLLRVTSRETFVSQSTIARNACLPVATARKHLTTLHNTGWIVNKGRQRIKPGLLRRTATIRLTPRTRKAMGAYSILPGWACSPLEGHSLNWCAKAVLSIVMIKVCGLKACAEKNGCDFDDFLMCVADNDFVFSLSYLQRKTGLSRHSVIKAKRELVALDIIGLGVDDGEPQVLYPNFEFTASLGNGQATDG